MSAPSTREAFVQAHIHELVGLVVDGMTRKREGGEASLFLEQVFRRCAEKLSQIWDTLHPQVPTSNGSPLSIPQSLPPKGKR
jgi:hypothetical protein